jgi:hypothetical protein
LIYLTGDSGEGKLSLFRVVKSFFGSEAVELNDLSVDPKETF